LSTIHYHVQLYIPHWIGLLWTSDQHVAEISTWQHATFTREWYPYPNPQSQQPSGCRPTP